MGATLLSPFAQQINDELEKRFGAAETARVREAWRLMDVDYVHKEALIEGHEYMKQEARSYLPGLTPMPFWDLTTTAWAQELEANWEVVRDEFRAVAMDDADNLKKKGNNVWVAAADSDSAASYGPDWRTLVLMDRTTWDPTNCNLFPKTAKLLSDAGVPCVEAFFAHLGLDIPPDCHITVGDETRYWKDGQVTMFDTSIFHDAVNDSDEYRYILMLASGTRSSRTRSGPRSSSSSTSSTCPTSSATTRRRLRRGGGARGFEARPRRAKLAPGAAKPKKNKKGGKKKKKNKAAGFRVAL
ncbi:aspartyl/asparaginyl beta-hydroxylase [Aureococcus anophagefferens]|nr:aspartyl/asparaginyl beta-hydroxylase [Aureococcus anophagefferens]